MMFRVEPYFYLKQDGAFNSLVQCMFGSERRKWAAKGYPHLQKKDVVALVHMMPWLYGRRKGMTIEAVRWQLQHRGTEGM